MQWLLNHLIFDFEMISRLLLAAILGLLLGIERETKRKSLGLRTILVISVVSCLLTIVSIQSAYIFPETTYAEIRMDPLRLAAQIVSGVGFLGAGVILRRGDDTVSGLTTAAIVWGAAGIGIAVGAGFYLEAIIGVLLLFVSIEFLPLLINQINFRKLHLTEYHIQVHVVQREDISNVIQHIKSLVEDMKDIHIKDLKNGTHLISARLVVKDDVTVTDTYNEIAHFNLVTGLEIDS